LYEEVVRLQTMPFFADIGKGVADLFKKKDYTLNKTVKVTIPDDNVKVETTVTDSGSLSCKTKYTQTGISTKFGGSLAITADTTDNYVVELKKLALASGVTSDLKLDTKDNTYSSTFKYSDAAYKAQFAYSHDKSVGASFVMTQEGISVGGEVSATFSSGFDVAKKDWNVGVEWAQGNSNYSLKTSDQIDNVTLAASKNYGSSTVAVQLKHGMSDGETSASVGGKFGLDDNSSVQGFLGSGGDVFALYKYRLSSRVTGSIAAQTNLGQLDGFQNVGYKLEFQ